jgi:hypothetical protein
MKNYTFFAIMLAFMLALAFGTHAATVFIEPADQECPPVGETITVSVSIRDVTDLYSCFFDLSFDNTALKFTSIEQGEFIGSDGADSITFLNNQAVAGHGALAEILGDLQLDPELLAAVNSASTMALSTARLGTADGIDGSGELVILKFEVLEVKASMIELQNASYSIPSQAITGETNAADMESGSISTEVVIPLPPVVREHADGAPILALEATYDEANVEGYTYIDIWEGNIPVDAESFLEFQEAMFSGNPTFRGTVDLHTTDGSTLRDSGAVDQNGLSAHPDTDLSQEARDRWYHRKISLAPLAGKTIDGVMIATDSSEHSAGIFRVYVDNIQITKDDGILESIWMGEPTIPITGTASATGTTLAGTEGMSNYSVTIVTETPVTPDKKLAITWGSIKSSR